MRLSAREVLPLCLVVLLLLLLQLLLLLLLLQQQGRLGKVEGGEPLPVEPPVVSHVFAVPVEP